MLQTKDYRYNLQNLLKAKLYLKITQNKLKRIKLKRMEKNKRNNLVLDNKENKIKRMVHKIKIKIYRQRGLRSYKREI